MATRIATPAPEAHAATWTHQLLDRGYCVIRGALARATIAALDADLAEDFTRTPFCQGGF